MELRLEVDEATGAVNGVAVLLGGSAVLLHAYAAPRSEGIWDEVRAEIGAGVTRQGGTADEVPGPFGRELLVRVPVRTADGRTGHQTQRFVGVDGPRWFLRAVFQGPAAHDEAVAAELESVVREVVVVRGGEAMAPRELLPLRLPEAAEAAATAEQEQAEAERPSLDPFTRGPEITEIRREPCHRLPPRRHLRTLVPWAPIPSRAGARRCRASWHPRARCTPRRSSSWPPRRAGARSPCSRRAGKRPSAARSAR